MELYLSDRLIEKVDEHDRMLIEMQTLFKGMVESQNKMADNIGEMAQAVNKMDLWLERLTVLDGNTKESFKRVWAAIEENQKDNEEKFKTLEVASFFSRYPKLLLLVIVGFCVLNIEPIRQIIFGG